ncbi:MAG: hypothetical protein Q4D17_11795, partial [Planctomycetia bacterium]|nr:hypothetical protein [Planctomycetia bacterium]
VLAAMVESAEYVTNEDGINEYTFLIKMQPTHATGTYVVRIGNNVAKTEKDFEFVNAYDIVDYYNALDKAVAEAETEDDVEIFDVLTGENSKCTYDLTEYKALSEDVRLLVDAEIEKLDLAATMENVADVETAFRTKLNEVLPWAVLADSETDCETWHLYEVIALLIGVLDGAYVDAVSEEVVEAYYKEAIDATIDANVIAEVYDEATLLAVVNELDYISVKEAIAYYEEKGILDIDEADYSEVVDKKLANNLAKEIRNRKDEATDIGALEDLIDEIAADLLEDAEESSSSSSSGGSGGGGG